MHCHASQPKFVFSSTEKMVYMIFKNEGGQVRVMLIESEIRKILENIVREDIQLLGFDPEMSHPKNMILTILPVLPPICRPFLMADSMTCDDDLTIQYLEIIKANRHLGDPTLNELRRQKYTQIIKFRIKCLFNNDQGNSKHSNGRPLKGIKKRLTGKEGLLRGNLLGKRVDKSARTVIGPDPTLRTNEIAIPPHIAEILSFPVRVTSINMDTVRGWIDKGIVNFILRNQGRTRINMKYALYKQGTKLQYGDFIRKRSTNRLVHIRYEKQLFTLEEGDQIIRNGEVLKDVVYTVKKAVHLEIGDIIERRLMDGDILLLNRQPTLHKGSMIAQKIRIIPGKTIRLNLATTKTFNADFDGDEMNLHLPASPEAEAELRLLSSVENNLISTQSGKANIVIVQDSLLSAYLMTYRRESIPREDFFQISMALRDLSIEDILVKMDRYRHETGREECTGKMLFSLLLPDDFFYEGVNNADELQPTVIIRKGLLLDGVINKSNLGAGHMSLITLLNKEYGHARCLEFLDNVQFLTNAYIHHYGFSVGIQDCMVTRKTEIEDTVARSFLQAQNMESSIQNDYLREAYIMRSLANARDTGMVIAKKAMAANNNFIKTVLSGSKGDYFNLCQITGLLGQQNLNGERIRYLISGNKRSLYHYPIEITSQDIRYESQGFIKNSFIHGLNPREYWFHSMTGREGITDTALKTASSGYIQRRMIKIAEDIQIHYDNTVRNSTNSIIQFAYGDNAMDPTQTVVMKDQLHICNVQRIAERLNYNFEMQQEQKNIE
jgi:DNA-directed RNA polymerase beta' subunit